MSLLLLLIIILILVGGIPAFNAGSINNVFGIILTIVLLLLLLGALSPYFSSILLTQRLLFYIRNDPMCKLLEKLRTRIVLHEVRLMANHPHIARHIAQLRDNLVQRRAGPVWATAPHASPNSIPSIGQNSTVFLTMKNARTTIPALDRIR